ncbi:major facilitator superfamily MFS_1 [Salinispora tropica CNB-440]|uniref:Major facilitator superfamily MFS_1 n=2 Tax=Salinispora tropica TaxID=168695 RepID=A4XD53_SALTO|nr:major facilitator superfamily MFS_1 [Salinispora tropica CNB-440]
MFAMFAAMFEPLRAARLATFTYFTLNGFVLGAWIVHIPAVEHRADISHATLGWLLLLLGAGAFAGMHVVGPLTDRFGARRVVPLSAVLCSTTLVLPAFAESAGTLGLALLVFGIGNGSLDVSMNTHAVQVEAGYKRPVMSAFHAMFSVGGVLAALVGARTLSWGWSPTTTLTMVSLLGLTVTAVVAPALLPRLATTRTPTPASATKSRRASISPRIWALAGLALILMLTEGVANDWSALAMRDALDAPAATAALAYGAFATAMTVGRFLTDGIAARFGPVAIVRYGCALAALALTTIALAPSISLALVGWALLGVGLSGAVPQLFSAAGHTDPDAAGTNVSRVAGLGYLGMLSGPAIIGPLTQLMPLNYTFILPAFLCLVAALTAHILRPREEAPRLEVKVPQPVTARSAETGHGAEQD